MCPRICPHVLRQKGQHSALSSFKLELVSNPGVCFPPGPVAVSAGPGLVSVRCCAPLTVWLLPALPGFAQPTCTAPGCLSPSRPSAPSTRSLLGSRLPCLCAARLGLWCVSVSVLLSPPLPLVYSLGFFSLNSIAYRRVIRVYQYEVGDDLSGRFFSSYFSSYLTVVYQCTRPPRRLRFLTNPLPSAAWDRGVCPPPPAPAPGPGGAWPWGHGMTESALLG